MGISLKEGYNITKNMEANALNEEVKLEDLDGIIRELDQDISEALDIRVAQQHFDATVAQLKAKEDKLKNVVATIENSKEAVRQEVGIKERQRQQLEADLHNMKCQRTELEAKILGHEQGIENLVLEKEQLDAIVLRMRDVLFELKAKVQQFGNSA